VFALYRIFLEKKNPDFKNRPWRFLKWCLNFGLLFFFSCIAEQPAGVRGLQAPEIK